VEGERPAVRAGNEATRCPYDERDPGESTVNLCRPAGLAGSRPWRSILPVIEDALAQLDDAKLADQTTVALPNGQSRTVTRAGAAIGHLTDMVDHYSQLANYMRLNNILPPTALPRPRPTGGE
jgi:hypothetical protein